MSMSFKFSLSPAFLPCGQHWGRFFFFFFVDTNPPPWPTKSFRDASSETEGKCLVLRRSEKTTRTIRPAALPAVLGAVSQCLPPESGYESSTWESWNRAQWRWNSCL